jgi:hypothetical protein
MAPRWPGLPRVACQFQVVLNTTQACDRLMEENNLQAGNQAASEQVDLDHPATLEAASAAIWKRTIARSGPLSFVPSSQPTSWLRKISHLA